MSIDKKCPKCGSDKISKDSSVPLKKNGIIQPIKRYKCKECGYQYTKSEYVQHFSKETRALALRLLSELSYREVAKVLGISNHSLIHYWDKRDNEMGCPLEYDNEKFQELVEEQKTVCEYMARINCDDSYYFQRGLKALNKLFP